tara:strand:- start:117 stop:245 length:129 start_codon:yes stop_codon:yes gene_type:complete
MLMLPTPASRIVGSTTTIIPGSSGLSDPSTKNGGSCATLPSE